jgi:hypothetical protein
MGTGPIIGGVALACGRRAAAAVAKCPQRSPPRWGQVIDTKSSLLATVAGKVSAGWRLDLGRVQVDRRALGERGTGAGVSGSSPRPRR